MTSGLGEGLLRFLCGGDAERVGAFVRVFGLEERRRGVEGGAGASALRGLVWKLKEAVSVREAFPVVLSDASGDLTAGPKLLAQPMKLRLAREAGETALSDYSANVVLIEPLATLKAVHDFLWAKVCHPPSDAPAAHTPGLAEAAAAVAAAAAAAAAAVAGGDKSGWAGGEEDGAGVGWGARGTMATRRGTWPPPRTSPAPHRPGRTVTALPAAMGARATRGSRNTRLSSSSSRSTAGSSPTRPPSYRRSGHGPSELAASGRTCRGGARRHGSRCAAWLGRLLRVRFMGCRVLGCRVLGCWAMGCLFSAGVLPR